MTTLVLAMGTARLSATVPVPKLLADGGGERVFTPTRNEVQVNGDRKLEVSATLDRLALVVPR